MLRVDAARPDPGNELAHVHAPVRHLVVDPHTRTVTIYGSRDESRLLTLGDDLEGGEVLPGFRIALAVLFEPYAPPAG